jgi:hypothetical protein
MGANVETQVPLADELPVEGDHPEKLEWLPVIDKERAQKA